MKDLKDIIKYENENTNLDFKKEQYKKEKNLDFIKDVMSMANADTNDDKYIIIGIKHHKDSGIKEIIGINEDLVDSSNYQQLILENIEPDINIEYFPYEYESHQLGVLKISNCINKPYMMKKDYNTLKKGDCYIRKGTYQTKMDRKDLDKIISERTNNNYYFDGKLEMLFSSNNSNILQLTKNSSFILPSEKAAEKIKKVLEEKRNSNIKEQNEQFIPALGLRDFYPAPYEHRSIAELEENLKNVQKDYTKDDMYEFFELYAHKINLLITNQGNKYLEDALVTLEFPRINGLFISKSIYSKPKDSLSRMMGYTDTIFEAMGYPDVKYNEENIIVSNNVGDLKHHQPIDAFQKPIRLNFSKDFNNQSIELICKIYAKNLKDSYINKLIINIK